MLLVAKNISVVERKWLGLLSEYTGQVFRSARIPSHDETHSGRVWSFAKELYLELEGIEFTAGFSELEQTLIAVFFHDLGMTRDPGPSHGKLSREMCLDFFKQTGLEKPKGFKLILDAIENHDDKTYRKNIYQNPERFSVFDVLCISDDLDAFGLTGVFRYWEIYKLRGIPEKLIPGKVLQNLDERFNHFREGYFFLNHFYLNHQKRFLKTKQFYSNLRKAFSMSYKVSPLSIRVIEIFDKKILGEHIHPAVLFGELEGKEKPGVIRFFRDFGEEFSLL